MYKRLLVALDGSTVAESILSYALGLCRATPLQLTLVRVIDDEDQRAQASRYVDALAARLEAEGQCISAEGDVPAAILKEAARVPGTLIAMTTHGRSGVLSVVLGSVAMKVLRSGREPVLLYRPHATVTSDPTNPLKITRIVVPMDSKPGGNAIAERAAELAHWLGAELVVISVLDPKALASADAPSGDLMESAYVQSHAVALGKQYEVESSWEVLHGDQPDQAIADYIGKDRNTMLAMITHANVTPLSAAFLGSVTTGCLRKVGVPMLVGMP